MHRLKTDEEGIAYNSFWVTDRAGLQLKKAAADLTSERMGDFLVYCTPSRKVAFSLEVSKGKYQAHRACCWHSRKQLQEM